MAVMPDSNRNNNIIVLDTYNVIRITSFQKSLVSWYVYERLKEGVNF
jgi:hypothetical protein